MAFFASKSPSLDPFICIRPGFSAALSPSKRSGGTSHVGAVGANALGVVSTSSVPVLFSSGEASTFTGSVGLSPAFTASSVDEGVSADVGSGVAAEREATRREGYR